MAVTVAVTVPVTGAAMMQTTAPRRVPARTVEATRRPRRSESVPVNGMEAPSAAFSLVIRNRSMSHQIPNPPSVSSFRVPVPGRGR